MMRQLPDFRGDSKFSTWVYKFAINNALMVARHERWKGVSLDQLSSSAEETFSVWVRQDKADGISPEQSAMQAELRDIIQEVILHDLTDKQRQVLVWIVFKEVPLDEVVRHLESNRNAVYKLLHDARRKLKSGLLQHGFDLDETLALFEAPG
jgi:RNA polymerase sigma-70 factor (ECF subfamily)